ncbi:hypothetical protein D3C76_1798730 [compost metagenome]
MPRLCQSVCPKTLEALNLEQAVILMLNLSLQIIEEHNVIIRYTHDPLLPDRLRMAG